MEKLTMQDYLNCLQAKKQEAHDKQWLYIEVNAKDLLEECEPGIRNQNVCCKAMLDAMLEGDGFIVEPKNKSKCAASLTIRYYVDNLSPERRKYAEVCNISICCILFVCLYIFVEEFCFPGNAFLQFDDSGRSTDNSSQLQLHTSHFLYG